MVDGVISLMTLVEAANYMAVSKTTLRRWTNSGQLSCHRVGPRNERRFDKRALDDFLEGTKSDNTRTSARNVAVLPKISGSERQNGDLASRHLCLFFRGHQERWEAFRPFFLKHLRAGHPTVYIYSKSTREEMRERVESEGIDFDDVTRKGLLTLFPASQAYLKNETFTPEYMLSFMRMQIIRKKEEKQPAHLIVGEMDWFFSGIEGADRIHEYEAALNDLLLEHPQTTIVCHYDLSRFSGADVFDACCSHPGVAYRKQLQPGYFAPPAG